MKSKTTKTMTALCIAQPWAFCIFEKGKNVENRSQNLKKRGTIAIYASATLDKGRFEYCNDDLKIKISPDELPFGAIVGFVDVIEVIKKKDVTTKTQKWFSGDYGYVLANPKILKTPISVKPPKGAIKFWELKGKALDSCLKQISNPTIRKFKPFE